MASDSFLLKIVDGVFSDSINLAEKKALVDEIKVKASSYEDAFTILSQRRKNLKMDETTSSDIAATPASGLKEYKPGCICPECGEYQDKVESKCSLQKCSVCAESLIDLEKFAEPGKEL